MICIWEIHISSVSKALQLWRFIHVVFTSTRSSGILTEISYRVIWRIWIVFGVSPYQEKNKIVRIYIQSCVKRINGYHSPSDFVESSDMKEIIGWLKINGAKHLKKQLKEGKKKRGWKWRGPKVTGQKLKELMILISKLQSKLDHQLISYS